MKKRKPLGKTRGSWFGIKPVTRTTPTLTERKRRAERKHKGRSLNEQ